jgi:hypothetical protein
LEREADGNRRHVPNQHQRKRTKLCADGDSNRGRRHQSNPIGGIQRDASLFDRCSTTAWTPRPGVMVKVGLNQLRNVLAWVTNQNWNPSEIDLVVTLGEIANFDPGTLIPAVINTIQNNIQNPSPWRTITLSSSSAPQDHGGLAVGRNDVPRLEWEVWSGVVAAALPYQIDYADYSTVTPDLTDPPGYVMSRATVSVRYTIDDYWIILKGRPTTGRTGQAMGQQYRAHGRTLVADRSFGGLVGCWTDGIIQQIANGTRSAGGRAQWAGYAANRHLSFIANRLP